MSALRVWDVESAKVECMFTLDAPVTAVAVIPDRRVIVAGDRSGRVHFFDLVGSAGAELPRNRRQRD
jgi:WD40 repeat protein